MSQVNFQKTATYAAFGLVAAIGILFVLDMWFSIFSWDNLGKLVITLVVVAVLLLIFTLVRRDLAEEEKMKKDKYMD